MGNIIKELLLQVLIVILPIFMYQVLWVDIDFKQKPKNTSLVIAFFVSLSIIMCITFSFQLPNGSLADLRTIPFLIGILYGGRRVGLVTAVILVLLRIVIGGSGVPISMIVVILNICLSFFFAPKFHRGNMKFKYLLASILALVSPTIIAIHYFIYIMNTGETNKSIIIGLFIFAPIISATSMLLAVYILEKMIENLSLRKAIRQSEDMLAQLAASVAHEVRNPMTVTKGFLQLFKEQTNPEKQQQYINIMIDEINRAESILSDYLSFAKPEVEQLKRIDASEQVLHVVNVMTSYALYQNVVIEHRIESSLFINADSKRLSQVLMNLCKNAIEAMPNGGVLEIHTKQGPDEVIIEIADSGVGMSDDQIARLGSPYYSTKVKGTGLGLMVCYKLVKAMNGYIKVKSIESIGTTFYLIFPSS